MGFRPAARTNSARDEPSEFDNDTANRQGLTEWCEIAEDRIGSNLEYFLKAVISPLAYARNAAPAVEWCAQKTIFFGHLRDVEAAPERFRETFHDNGPADLTRMLRLCYDCGFDGPPRPDHAPTPEGESNDRPGHSMGGKLFAFGYMMGAMDAMGIPYV